MITKIKGTKDYNYIEYELKNFISSIFEELCLKNGFKFIETPIIESTNLFKRTVQDSDIAQKEMYDFLDKSQREISLRPEGTAPFVRAYIENKWYTEQNQRFAYNMPMFRYEQPQKGRYRQFYQAGVEFVGEKNYLKDIAVIYLAASILDYLEIPYKLKINSIGNLESRKNYELSLKNYLIKFKDQLTQESQKRLLENNVLRILDDKIDSKLDFIKSAPKIKDYLSKESQTYYNNVKTKLDELGIKYFESNELVRGLDYYDEVVFEFVADTKDIGSQSTIIGGGRYSNLIKELGGPDLSSVGFGFGIDRCASLIRERFIKSTNIEQEINNCDIYVSSSLNETNLSKLFDLTYKHLINLFPSVEFEFNLIKSKKLFEKANKKNAKIIIYDDKMLQPIMFCAKNLLTNDKIIFQNNNQGIADLLRFLEECDLDIDINELEEYIEGLISNE
ncbi:histidine--tRNA ligase [Mycoplasmopsis felis]|uniref:histidine--tRNA ligase n=1 Tax=Mycoplasmopsis felis TaxID=33923 RepID=UPI002AFF35BA|nr:histidine--tRNA ligase [Mycoplasmopsis felis]WQQ10195.1 histidine--tRNA ligase [Mycoplasmopsis felis]